MARMNMKMKNLLAPIAGLRSWWRMVCWNYIAPRRRNRYAYCADSALLEYPMDICDYSLVSIGEHVRVRKGFTFIGYKGRFIVRKNTVIAMNCTVVTDNHVANVGIPSILSIMYHVNDDSKDVIIEEDAWIGVNCTLLPGARVGRRAIIGACSMVNKEIPPYAVAVGTPAKIVASVFTIDEILEHERMIYPENERLSREYLEQLLKNIIRECAALA